MAKKQNTQPVKVYTHPGMLVNVATQQVDPIRVATQTGNTINVLHKGLDYPVEYPMDADLKSDPFHDIIRFESAQTPYMIRGLREQDGEQISKYKTMLPYTALEALVGRADDEDEDSMNPDESESLDAFYEPDGNVITGLVYTNWMGRWLRQDGEWTFIPPNDKSFDGDPYIPIDPASADQLVALFDSHYLSTDDASNYEDQSATNVDDSLDDDSDPFDYVQPTINIPGVDPEDGDVTDGNNEASDPTEPEDADSSEDAVS